MALVNGGFLHYTDMKKFLKKTFSETACQILQKFHRNGPWMTLFKNCLQNYNLSINMALVNGGFLQGHEGILKKKKKKKILRKR